jgi:N-acetylneuraminic acid mutarotase
MRNKFFKFTQTVFVLILALSFQTAHAVASLSIPTSPFNLVWTTKMSMPTPRGNLAVVTANNGKIYAIGGVSNGNLVVTNEEYDPATDTWTTKASMPTLRDLVSAVAANNGKIYAIGGRIPVTSEFVGTNEEYDPATDAWTTKASMPTPREGVVLAAPNNGKIYAIGGGPANYTVEEYDPTTDTWATKTSIPVEIVPSGVATSGVTTTNDGKVIVIAGTNSVLNPTDGLYYEPTEEYDPASDSWTALAPVPPVWCVSPDSTSNGNLGALGAVMAFNNRIYAIGGYCNAFFSANSVNEEYDPVSNTWSTALTNMPTSRYGLGVVLGNNGKIYTIGGITTPGDFQFISVGTVEEATIMAANTPPEINQIPDSITNLGNTYTAYGSFTDPDSNSWTATVDYGDGSGTQSLTPLTNMGFTLNHIYNSPGSYTVTINITDNQGAIGTANTTVTVNPIITPTETPAPTPTPTIEPTPTPTPVNVPPVVGTITAPSDPVQVNTSITANAAFTDANTTDTHTASWTWGDGSSTTGTVTESNGSGTVVNSHVYTQAGVYTISLTVTDNYNAFGIATYQYVTVFDPSAGWVTGSKEFTSPAGAVIANPSVTGKASWK